MKFILVILFLIIVAPLSAHACEIADVCNAGCAQGQYFDTSICQCVTGADPYHCNTQTTTTIPVKTTCTAVQTANSIVDQCTENEPSTPPTNCNGMNATNTTCAPGTEWDDTTCSCKTYCKEGSTFNFKTNACEQNR